MIKIGVLALAAVFASGSDAREYFGFRVCESSSVKEVVQIAQEHGAKVIRQWDRGMEESKVVTENFMIESTPRSVEVMLYNGMVSNVKILNAKGLQRLIERDFGAARRMDSRYALEDYTETTYSFLGPYDPMVEVTYISRQSEYADLTGRAEAIYQCTPLFRKYQADMRARS
jgi:hypothetical protein